ncbi:response regulator [Pseudodesulfovibrio sp. JC047]|uniref:sigma-54-dependent transcriptional regulator n=1 Tax=Pseudodesulfovibrio sp. JC047 TaxID=2683199 RepID=UPI0013D78B30|nr:sigma-54 dependent transcriptional regulator [Pseudodesulfovibrio sp. JC047]NDV18449.1 response regulator [Pseudodesulfovibrio sp. JC047]
MGKILLVDDEPLQHILFQDVAADQQHEFVGAFTLEDGKTLARETAFDMVFLDVILPDGNGIENVQTFKAYPGNPEVVIITSKGDISGAAKTLEDGGGAYLLKPLSVDRIEQSVKETFRFRKDNHALGETTVCCTNILGGPRIEACKKQTAKAAHSSVPVVIYGETGTGKELFARAVHDHSPRAKGPFVALDCASISPSLIASLLFGHVRGAFTGADRDRQGVVAMAHNGTLFLDEIGELPLEQQASLLRILETHRFRPVGGQHELESDFRLVAATNRNLEEMVLEGTFRSDLLYRLQGVTINLPPLRDRIEDIELLVEHRLHESEYNDKTVSKEFLATLQSYDWPGNVRELIHTVDSALAAAYDSPVVYARHLPMQIRIKAAQAHLETLPDHLTPNTPFFPTLKEYRLKTDREYVQNLLKHTEGNVKKAAEIAGISRGYLYEMMKKCGLHR